MLMGLYDEFSISHRLIVLNMKASEENRMIGFGLNGNHLMRTNMYVDGDQYLYHGSRA